jgi:SPP1 gp7 family putative phage head morphogenesis protein
MEYWQERQEAMYKAGEMKVNQYFTKLEKAFNQTRRELQKTIEAFYFRYAEENGLSFAAAQKKLDAEELGELQDFIDLAMANIGRYNQTVNNMSIKARITRYQALEAQVDAILRQLYAIDYEAEAEKTMQEIYEGTYYRTWYNIDQYHGFHAEFAQVSPTVMEKLLEYPFNGAAFSSRLWKQKNHLQAQLMEAVTTMLIQGKHPSALTKEFAKKTNSKKFDAYRLLHTESSFLMSEATHAGYAEDGVPKYEILATLDSKTCSICGDLDNEVYEVGKEVVGVNMPPFHPLCRCTTVPHYDDTPTEGLTRVARNPETGKTYEVPADMSYREWKKKFIEKTSKFDTIEPENTKEDIRVHSVGKIDRDIYKCITDDIVTNEVIITDERIGHIKERHPNDYERYCEYLKLIIESPDYIVETKKPNTALILKEIKESEERQFKTVLRLTTSTDNPDFKNSIITFMKIDEKEWRRLLRNKQILYKRE